MKKSDPDTVKRILRLSQLLTSAVLLVAAVLNYLDTWKYVNYLIPLLGILQLLNGFLYWEMDRDCAAFSLIMAVFIGIVCIIIFI